MFYLSEQFLSIQGEGKYAGFPSYFLRTAVCNLSCQGFGATYETNGIQKRGCDTYFAVDSYFSKTWTKIEDASKIILHLQSKFKTMNYKPHIVITGGEPLLYYRDEVFYRVVSWLVEKNFLITFETNGTVDIDFQNYPAYKKTIFALSIKLANSKEPKNKRIKPKAISKIINNSFDSFFKFTINRELIETTAFEEIREITENFPNIVIYCMPVGECRNNIWNNDKAVFEFCMKHGFRYSDRLHIRVFDTTQGV